MIAVKFIVPHIRGKPTSRTHTRGRDAPPEKPPPRGGSG